MRPVAARSVLYSIMIILPYAHPVRPGHPVRRNMAEVMHRSSGQGGYGMGTEPSAPDNGRVGAR